MSNLRRSAYLLAFFGMVAFGVSLIWTPAPLSPYTGLAQVRIPENVAGFRSQRDETISEQVQQALSTADIVSRTYSSSNGRSFHFTMIAGTDRSALHDPRSCLVGAGWRIEKEHTEALSGTGITAQTCWIVRDSPRQKYEVVYLYVVNNEIVTQATQIRFGMLLSALIGSKGTPTVFIRFMRPIQEGDEMDAANRTRFLEFAGQMWTLLRPGIIKSE